MTLKLITAPAAEPVTLTEAKLHLRVEHTADDDLITALIVAARQEAEHLTGRALITQTWARVLDAFPSSEIELGMPPVQSISSITYTDTAGDAQTMDSADYTLDSTTEPGWALPSEDAAIWPSTQDTANAVTVTFLAGYGASGSSVPATIRAWIKIRVGTLYKMREGVGMNVSEVPHVDRLLEPFRRWGI